MKKFLFTMLLLLATTVMQAGEIIINKVDVENFGFDDDAELIVRVKVTIEVTGNLKEKEWAIMMLMDNARWNDDVTHQQFYELTKKLCYGEMVIPATSSGLKYCRINVPVNTDNLSGKGSSFYIRPYLFDMENIEITAKGPLIKYTPDYAQLKKQIKEEESSLTSGLLGGLLGIISGGGSSILDILGGGGSPDPGTEILEIFGSGSNDYDDGQQSGSEKKKKEKKCSTCGGSGKCNSCHGSGRGLNYTDNCSSCYGHGSCRDCSGTGRENGGFFW